jgi:hypothetical protein
MPQTDIIIKLGGAQAKTIRAKASALDALAMSVGKVKAAFTGAPFQQATQGMQGFNQQIRKATTGAKSYGRQVQKAGERTDRFGTRIKGAGNALDNFGTLFRRMVRIMAAFFIISAITRLVREFVTTIATAPMQMELWTKQLIVLSKNATLAAERLELLKRVAIETPLELPDLFQGLTTLQAFSVEISERTIPLITDLAAVSGRTFREVAEVIGKVIAGSPTAITRSLPTLAIDPNEFKRVAAELGSRSEALWQIISGKFEGFAKESATTVIGVLSNIKDAWFVIMADIGEGALGPLRKAIQSIMDYLEELRHSPARLKKIENQVRLITDSLVEFAKSIVRGAQAVGRIVEFMGGFRVVLGTIIFLLGQRVLAGFARVVAGWVGPLRGATRAMTLLNIQMSLWLIAANAAIALLAGLLLSKYAAWKDAMRSARLEQVELNDELGRMNRTLERNIDLVDAATVARQGARVHGAGVAFPFSTYGKVTARQMFFGETDLGEEMKNQFDEARKIAMEFGSDDELRRLFERTTVAMGQAALFMGPEKDFQNLFDQLKSALMAKGTEMIGLAKTLRERAGRVIDVPAVGEGEEDEVDRLKEFFDFWKSRFEPFKTQFDLIQGKFDAGLITREAARNQIVRLKELLEVMRRALLLDPDPLMQQVALMLSPTIANLDSFIGDLDSEITDAFRERLTEIKLKISLGLDPEAATAALMKLKEEIVAMMENLGDDLTPEMEKVFQTLLSGINSALESLKPDDLGQAFAQAITQIIKQGSDAVADAIAAMFTPEMGLSLTQAMGQMFAGMLNVMGDSMIQIGIAMLTLQKALANITSPVGAAALIAGGILLKAMAASIGAKMGDAAQGGSSSGGGAAGTINYPQFSAGAYGDKRSWYVEIHAMDAQSFEDTIARNPAAFGRQIAVIAREDKATGGQAYGAFQPA